MILAVGYRVNSKRDILFRKWATQVLKQLLFNTSTDNIGLHIKNIILDDELNTLTSEEYSVVQQEGTRKVKRKIKIYNLDMIISVGYRVKSNHLKYMIDL